MSTTLTDLANLLKNEMKLKDVQIAGAVDATAKMIAFKYEAELYKIFRKEDIIKANELSEEEAKKYLESRYESITGEKTGILLSEITDSIVAEVMAKPTEYFDFSKSS